MFAPLALLLFLLPPRSPRADPVPMLLLLPLSSSSHALILFCPISMARRSTVLLPVLLFTLGVARGAKDACQVSKTRSSLEIKNASINKDHILNSRSITKHHVLRTHVSGDDPGGRVHGGGRVLPRHVLQRHQNLLHFRGWLTSVRGAVTRGGGVCGALWFPGRPGVLRGRMVFVRPHEGCDSVT